MYYRSVASAPAIERYSISTDDLDEAVTANEPMTTQYDIWWHHSHIQIPVNERWWYWLIEARSCNDCHHQFIINLWYHGITMVYIIIIDNYHIIWYMVSPKIAKIKSLNFQGVCWWKFSLKRYFIDELHVSWVAHHGHLTTKFPNWWCDIARNSCKQRSKTTNSHYHTSDNRWAQVALALWALLLCWSPTSLLLRFADAFVDGFGTATAVSHSHIHGRYLYERCQSIGRFCCQSRWYQDVSICTR